MLRLLWCAALLAACAETPDLTEALPADDPHWDHEDDGAVFGKADGAQCASRWVMPESTKRVAATQSVPYVLADACTGRAQAGARAFGKRMRARFGEQIDLAVLGRGIQIYNCRVVRGGRSRSIHGEGRAVDIFIPLDPAQPLGADNAKGDVVARWLVENAEAIGVQSIIWDRTRWKATGADARCYGGRHPHHDHLHVELSWAAARGETPFFQPGWEPVTPEAPAEVRDAFVGSRCDEELTCGFDEGVSRGFCLETEGTAGVCSLECAGYCPDREGFAGTFCVASEAMGLRQGLGVCAVKASQANEGCATLPDMEPATVERYTGASGVPTRSAQVCVPRAPEVNNCPWAVTEVGLCRQGVATRCEDGEVVREDCKARDMACEYIGGRVGCADPELLPDDLCDGIDGDGVCETGAALWCVDGRLEYEPCAAGGSGRCEVVEGRATCIYTEPPRDPCTDMPHDGRCDGATIVEWCDDGEYNRFDCATDGYVCRYEDDFDGHWCRRP